MMQSLWKYVDDLVGKGLDAVTVLKFLLYASASLLILVMPIAILLSSIMTFGNLGEKFELVAIKASGISLLRFMRPLMWVAVLLCGITFFFANYVIPIANLKFKALYSGILYKKPALDLKEGTFYTAIPGYSIKIAKKDADGKTIHKVIIYEQQNTLQDNCIIAEKGIMQLSADEKYLEFTLQNGYRYQERGNTTDTSTEFISLGFKEYKKLIDIESLKLATTPDSVFKNDSRAMTIPQINKLITKLSKDVDSIDVQLKKNIDRQIPSMVIADTTWKKTASFTGNKKAKRMSDLLPDSLEESIKSGAVRQVDNIKSTLEFRTPEIENQKKEIRIAAIEWHHKISLSFACLVLFFIGAPLGSIIRKGGLGMPIVVAIVFFLIFHLLNMFGEKFVRDALVPTVVGTWLPIIVLAPVGFFFTYKAMHDSQLFNKEFYYRVFRKMKLLVNNSLPRK